jgi:hypothetical protein
LEPRSQQEKMLYCWRKSKWCMGLRFHKSYMVVRRSDHRFQKEHTKPLEYFVREGLELLALLEVPSVPLEVPLAL